MRVLLSCVILVVAALLPSLASAQARHERTTIAPIREGGKVVGAKISVVLRPSGARNSATIVLGKPMPSTSSSTYRALATGTTPGYVQYSTSAISVPKDTPHSFSVMYGKGNVLQSGDVVDVASVWETGNAGDAEHVWGMARQGIPPENHTLP